MREALQFYIDGRWVAPHGSTVIDVIDPADAGVAGRVAIGDAADVDVAVAAARRAFDGFSRTSVTERAELLDAIIAAYQKRAGDFADAVTAEMGAPAWLASAAQVPIGLAHLQVARQLLDDYAFSEQRGATLLVKEPVGVCGFITPWNWPLNQIACKVAPALAVGCTMVLKPSEVAPFTGHIFAEVLAEAGVPAGVFNLVHGDGPGVGAALSSHPEVDMVSFTGSTRAGVEVARAAAPTVKRVHQELGGKSANIVLPSADLEQAVTGGVGAMMVNSGQSCNAPSRMLVPAAAMPRAKEIAAEAAATHNVGAPSSNAQLGPVVSGVQWDKIQRLIQAGIDEGATLVAGGPGRPEGLEQGFYVRPTVFADVTNDMEIAREEIFGPVLTILGYDDVEQAIGIANDTPYGLAAYVQGEQQEAQAVAAQLRAGQVYLNYPELDMTAPFGGYKQSGNGREWGAHAFGEFLEVKAVMGVAAADR
ncbi:aldehyde dehydrogenase family protein [Sphingomonas endophytica]|uniref:Aldehyde dehydrogenase n=1 Tax=Sphingomonas endophytica TaxID=869719 RepID=A0A147HZ99_9SPHN|nr:aldehyde dehydrogenase family protein [Sphingomonas endophytica]KTT70278.1 aldehyde dehydrogenase [Sphingomonas endophytica]